MSSFGEIDGTPIVVGELYVVHGGLYSYTGLVETPSFAEPKATAVPQFRSCSNEHVTLTYKMWNPLRIRPATEDDILRILDENLSFELGKVTDELTVLVEPFGIHVFDNESDNSLFLTKKTAKLVLKHILGRINL